MDGEGVRLDMGPVLGRHHPDEGVGEEVHLPERALARQGIEGQVAEAALAELADRLVEREPAGETDPHAVRGDLLEVGGRRGAELLLDVTPAARGHHHRVPE